MSSCPEFKFTFCPLWLYLSWLVFSKFLVYYHCYRLLFYDIYTDSEYGCLTVVVVGDIKRHSDARTGRKRIRKEIPFLQWFVQSIKGAMVHLRSAIVCAFFFFPWIWKNLLRSNRVFHKSGQILGFLGKSTERDLQDMCLLISTHLWERQKTMTPVLP